MKHLKTYKIFESINKPMIKSSAFKRAMIDNGVSIEKDNNVIWHLGSEHVLRTKKELRRIIEITNNISVINDISNSNRKERIKSEVLNKIIKDSIKYSQI